MSLWPILRPPSNLWALCPGGSLRPRSAFLLFVNVWMHCLSGDAVNNASGLGYNGYDSKGKQKWDLISNVNILGLEVSGKLLLLCRIKLLH